MAETPNQIETGVDIENVLFKGKEVRKSGNAGTLGWANIKTG
jgi:hypothetical protein